MPIPPKFETFRFIDQLPSICFIRDNNGDIVLANKQAIEQLGLQLIQKNDRTVYKTDWHITGLDGELLPATASPHFKIQQTGRPVHHVPLGMLRSDGERRFYIVDGRPIFHSEGEFLGSLLTGIEATAPIEAVAGLSLSEMRLQLSEQRYDSLYRKTPAILHSIDANGLLIEVSNKWLETFGYSRDEVIGRASTEFLTAESQIVAREIALPQFIRDGYIFQQPYQFVSKSGLIHEVLLSAVSEFDGNGNFVKSMAVLEDVTEKKQRDAQITAYNDRVRQLAARLSDVQEKERRDLARELHDQIGQKLAALSINLNIVGNKIDDPDLQQRLTVSQELIEETMSGIRDIMAELRPSVLDDHGLSAALEWLANRFQNQTMIKTVATVSSERLPRDILSNTQETAVLRIAQEALNNVMRHAQATLVNLSIQQTSRDVTVIIQDNGVGFDFSARAEPTDNGGWGLALMQERALSVGGQVSWHSNPYTGTTVIIKIPAVGS